MSFVWNGVSSDTMKFNVTSRQVYNAPAYDLNAIEVPGRSGDLLNPQNRFKNKQVTYTGFLKASDFEGSTWREKLSTGLIQLKGWLCSDAGAYHELTDDYDPGFTRYGYISGETAISDIEDRPFGVTLTVTFNVKPYMYKAGEPMELPETKSASGSIITITDGAENTPLKSAVVNIEPVQDLHGYDSPWPAGGGLNKLPSPATATKTANGITISVNNGVYSISGTASSQAEIIFDLPSSVTYDNTYKCAFLNDAVSSGITVYWRNGNTNGTSMGFGGGTNRVAEYSSSGTFNKVRFIVSSGTAITGTLHTSPVLCLKTDATPTTFSPYSNICPISGWSEVKVTRAGKNLFDKATGAKNLYVGVGNVTGTGGTLLCFSAKKGVQYTINMTGGNRTNLYYYDGSVSDIVAGITLTTVSLSAARPYTFIADRDGTYCYYADTNYQQAVADSCTVNVGSTAQPYAAPTLTPITIPLGRTVYGGTLDVVRGKLVVDRAIITPNVNGLQSINAYNIANFTFSFSGQEAAVGDYKLLAISNALKVQTSLIGTTQEQGLMISNRTLGYLRLDGLTVDTVAKANDWVVANNFRIVYYLETPIEVDLTPHTIKTLLGVNNIWADAGSMEIEYPIPTESPYPFESRPLYEITMAGTGTLIVNSKEWTITDYTGTLYCDTEAMEWYDASQLRNNIVSGDGWPVFEAGENSVSYTGDITQVMVTPRWRTL